MQLHKHILLHNWGTWGLSVWEQAGCAYIRLFARCPSPILSEDWRAGQGRSVDWGYRQESAGRFYLGLGMQQYNFIDFLLQF